MAEIRKVSCFHCIHKEEGVCPSAFSIYPANTEKEKQLFIQESSEKQLEEEQEKLRIDQFDTFVTKPKFNPWCSKFTLSDSDYNNLMNGLIEGETEDIDNAIDNGKIFVHAGNYFKTFILTAHQNNNEKCEGFESIHGDDNLSFPIRNNFNQVKPKKEPEKPKGTLDIDLNGCSISLGYEQKLKKSAARRNSNSQINTGREIEVELTKDLKKNLIKITEKGLSNSYGIFGAPGSGKTFLMKFMLSQLFNLNSSKEASKIGGLILDPKGDLIDDITQIVKDAGRFDDLKIINTKYLNSNNKDYNILDCNLKPDQLGALLVLAGRSAGNEAKDPSWFQTWSNLFNASIGLLSLAQKISKNIRLNLRMLLIHLFEWKVLNGIDQRRIQILSQALNSNSHKFSYKDQENLKIWSNTIKRFYSKGNEKTITVVESFIEKSFGAFRKPEYNCYSGENNRSGSLYKNIIQEGHIVLVSISPSEPFLAKSLTTLIKCLFQRTVLSRKEMLIDDIIDNDSRPLVIACDEYSQIASEIEGQAIGDGDFLSLARQYGCTAIFATQSINVLKSSTLGDNWSAVFSNFAAKIFMRLADNETAEEASNLAGESDYIVSSTGSSTSSSGTGVDRKRQIEERKKIKPSTLTQTFIQGEGVVIGSVDGGKTKPIASFIRVPDEKTQNEILATN